MKIHGEWEISLVRNIVIRTFAGAFNEQGFNALFEELKAIAPRGRPWASMAQGQYWEMAPEAALKSYSSMLQWVRKHGCEYVVFVCPSKFHLDIMKRNAGVNPDERFHVCETTEEACAWLTSKGFPLSIQEYPHHAFIEKVRIELESDPHSSFFKVA
ncbi:hypothetical protein [Undibacterium griseum]|uniref:STAS/SEC14 domain-containing protein n=1 Tax=Undibacterium griseum TaxID=2762295 RepID=A0ABR6YKY9_9BURK|nr:hypothetical protein [Undibacterium griseum]MBC3884572.1 hypothetical protein [Undibacterium griseum]